MGKKWADKGEGVKVASTGLGPRFGPAGASVARAPDWPASVLTLVRRTAPPPGPLPDSTGGITRHSSENLVTAEHAVKLSLLPRARASAGRRTVTPNPPAGRGPSPGKGECERECERGCDWATSIARGGWSCGRVSLLLGRDGSGFKVSWPGPLHGFRYSGFCFAGKGWRAPEFWGGEAVWAGQRREWAWGKWLTKVE